MHIPQPCSRREHWHPPNDLYPPIVGRIYPIPIYKNSTDIYFPNCWQNISNTNEYKTGAQFFGARFAGAQFAAKGPNLPGPNLPGPNLPTRGPICRGPICRQGAQSAGARFAKKWQIGPQKVRGPICRQIGEGPNLPGPNLPRTAVWEELHPMGPVKELIANKRKSCNSFNAIILFSCHYQGRKEGRGVLVRTRSLAFPKVHLCFYLLIFDQY